jgi:hypothetical protein
VFSPKRKANPGPNGPDAHIIPAVVEMKQRNPTWGCPRIAQQVNLAFGTCTDKDVVRRILEKHYQSNNRCWWTIVAHVYWRHAGQLVECRSPSLRIHQLRMHWILVLMDQYTRRTIGFRIQAEIVDRMTLCRMFEQAIRGTGSPKYLSSDQDPLYRFHQWQANLRILDIRKIKTVPYVPLSHPFVERLIGTIRREGLDGAGFGAKADRV